MTTPSLRKKKRTVNSLIDYWEAPTAPLPAPLFTPSRKSVIAFEEELSVIRNLQDKTPNSTLRKKKKVKEDAEPTTPSKFDRSASIEDKQRERQRNEAAREIWSTEGTYVHGLQTFVNVCKIVLPQLVHSHIFCL